MIILVNKYSRVTNLLDFTDFPIKKLFNSFLLTIYKEIKYIN